FIVLIAHSASPTEILDGVVAIVNLRRP
ncbi:hypothetical protein A2U01_0075198, partial [Trifolium medium]|nr:hypothetical protein [Trifolium medium]